MAARALGAPAAWMGFLGGAIGAGMRSATGISGNSSGGDFYGGNYPRESGNYRRVWKITELLEPGAARAWKKAMGFCALVRGIREEWKPAVLAISGSLPAGLGADFYAALIEAARAAGTKVFVDTSGEALACRA